MQQQVARPARVFTNLWLLRAGEWNRQVAVWMQKDPPEMGPLCYTSGNPATPPASPILSPSCEGRNHDFGNRLPPTDAGVPSRRFRDPTDLRS